ncbi:MAG: ribosomal RNA small subunit methyltransferase A [Bacteroidia bacterium]|nr:ribosomal RNA small subunit methyltransferase A [Bacteroidia bacterium]
MVKPKKHLGQHFLTDSSIAKKIAVLSKKSNTTTILEVGPGKGILTKQLLEIENKDVFAVEIDSESIDYLLSKNIISAKNLFKIDFLKFDFNTKDFNNIILIGNFPYNISSQIVFKMLEYRDKIDFMAGMFQKEVAQRIASNPNSKNYGILSVLVQAFYNVKIEFKIGPGAFFPPPKVDSAVISCSRKENFKLDCDEILFFDVVKTAFNQRRKIISNSLQKFNLINKSELNEFLYKRPENLSVENFVDITNSIKK